MEKVYNKNKRYRKISARSVKRLQPEEAAPCGAAPDQIWDAKFFKNASDFESDGDGVILHG